MSESKFRGAHGAPYADPTGAAAAQSCDNTRVLIVDDNRAIHDDFRKVLAPPAPGLAALAATEAALFGAAAPPRAPLPCFELESAHQGLDAVLLAERAVADGRPFSVAFVDVRMPPGIDGIETTRRLWAADPDLQVVICTAYSDYAWDEMLAVLDRHAQVVVLKKPFDGIEAQQLACALAEKWRLECSMRRALRDLEERDAGRTRELERANAALAAEAARTRDLARASQNMMEDAVAAATAARERGAELARLYADFGRFAHVAAHDLQEPLRAVMSCAQLLARRHGGGADAGAAELLGFVDAAVRRMGALVEGLQDYADVVAHPPERRPASLEALLDAAVQALGAPACAAAAITRDALPELPVAARRMVQLFHGLLDNALKFHGGRPPRVHVSARREGAAWLVSVRDHGAGVDPAQAEQIFVPFRRGDRPADAAGTAAGLPLCRRIVEAHGGRLWVEPAGPGAVFRFTLPDADPESRGALGRLA